MRGLCIYSYSLSELWKIYICIALLSAQVKQYFLSFIIRWYNHNSLVLEDIFLEISNFVTAIYTIDYVQAFHIEI